MESRLRGEGVEPVQYQANNTVNLVSFRSGKGELFRKMLLQDKEFKPLRQSLEDSGYPLMLSPSQTIVLVRPDHGPGVEDFSH